MSSSLPNNETSTSQNWNVPLLLIDAERERRKPAGAEPNLSERDLAQFQAKRPQTALPEWRQRRDKGIQQKSVKLIANVLKHLIRESSLLAPDFRSFKSQELTFVSLNLFLLVALLLMHILFPSYFGSPPLMLVVVLASGFLANAVELVWMRGKRFLSPNRIVALTWATIALNMTIAFALASLSYRQDIQYFALMLAPILQAAFRLSLGATLLAVTASASLIFSWVWNYFRLHPPSDLNEYIEAGTISLIYAIAGLLVWALVNHLRAKQTDLAKSLVELEQAKERLVIEQKLAAVGRFSTAIAHEIRNPVAMISSALTTAFNRGMDSEERQEMFEIAAKEASRLEKLTTDFLAYARPRSPSKERGDVGDSIEYIADICRPRAAARAVDIHAEAPDGLWADIDGGQIQQALLNLAMNAIEASPSGAMVVLRGTRENGRIRIEVENTRGPIAADAVGCIFEPFFTTKPSGTGLGLAIAHSIVVAHRGELVLSRNEPGLVQFSIILPAYTREAGS
jgi:two-component system, NtrC family, sensor histidine kinase HydH